MTAAGTAPTATTTADEQSAAQPQSQESLTPTYQPTQEVRLAVVMYGGVSLAIYINGVVQELLHLVRATAPAEAASATSFPDTLLLRKVHGSEKVYRQLGQLVEAREGPPAEKLTHRPADDAPILTRFVVDILSGSSAGGINGVFLAKALAGALPLDGLKRLWVEQGDIVKLLQDERSYADLPPSIQHEQPPRSLLNTRRMYYELLQALSVMEQKRPQGGGDSPLVDELDLWITATDVHGLILPIGLYDEVVYEGRYRKAFRFTYLSKYAGGGARRDYFGPEFSPLLAFACRATSSFPFAFDPMSLADAEAVLGQPIAKEQWSAVFDDYGKAGESDDSIQQRPFVDGGYLDNKPFTWATHALQRRQSDLPVDRKLIYVEPDPGSLHALHRVDDDSTPVVDRDLPLSKPDAIDSSLLAFTLPRKETIREDLDDLLERNRLIARTERLIEDIEGPLTDEWRSLPPDEWLALSPEKLAGKRGPQYLAYYRLKLATVLDDLSEVAMLRLGLDPNSDERSAIRCFVQAWFDRTKSAVADQNQFLLDFDVGFRLRRITFIQHRIDGILRDPATPADLRATLRDLRRTLNWSLVRLRRAGREVRARADLLAREFAGLLSRQQLLAVLAQARNERESVAKADAGLGREPQLIAKLTALATEVADQLRPTLETTGIRDVLEAAATDARLAPLFDVHERFEAFDSVSLPIAYAETGEANRVEVIRVSPEDATAIRDEVATGLRKLGGIEIGHFGGFVHEAWRANDILWGRLDAAERIITSMLREDEASDELRARLIHDGHVAILQDELGMNAADAEKMLERLATEDVARELAPAEIVPLVRRTISVTGNVLGGIESRRDVGALSRIVARVGSAVLRLAELATRTPLWAALLPIAAAGLLIELGVELDPAPSARVGWTLLPFVTLAGLGLVALRKRIEGIRLTRPAQQPAAPAPPPPPPPSQGGPVGFPTPADAAANGHGVGTHALLALIVIFLLLIFPLALLNDDISVVVSWLPGWN